MGEQLGPVVLDRIVGMMEVAGTVVTGTLEVGAVVGMTVGELVGFFVGAEEGAGPELAGAFEGVKVVGFREGEEVTGAIDGKREGKVVGVKGLLETGKEEVGARVD